MEVIIYRETAPAKQYSQFSWMVTLQRFCCYNVFYFEDRRYVQAVSTDRSELVSFLLTGFTIILDNQYYAIKKLVSIDTVIQAILGGYTFSSFSIAQIARKRGGRWQPISGTHKKPLQKAI